MDNTKLLRHFLLGISGSLLIVAGLFFAAANPGRGIQPERVLEILGQSSIPLLIGYIGISLIGIWLRAIRYRILIIACGEKPEGVPELKQMLLITAVRGMVVDFLPARLGELIYVALLKKLSNTSIPSGLSSLLFAILLDIAVLAPVTILIGLIIGFPNTTPLKVAILAVAILVVFYIGIRYLLPIIMDWINRLKLNQQSLIGKLIGFINDMNLAVQTTLHAGVFLKVFFLSIIVRILKYAGLILLFNAVVSGNFPDLEILSTIKTLAAIIASEMSAALPIPTLMSFGAWEIGGMTFMALFGAPPQDSLLALLAVHIQTQAVDYGIGITALFILFFGRSAKGKPTKKSPNNSVLIFGFAAFALIAITTSWYSFSNQSSKFQIVSENLNIPIELRPTWMKELNGFIIWASNRGGNHNIMMMALPDQTIKQITDHPNTETHPRISPDGSTIVFSRSKQKWVSWRDQIPWEVWTKNLKSGEERMITDNGISPTWSSDGKSIYFQRGKGEIYIYDIKSNSEKLLFQRNIKGIPNSELNYPSISNSGQLAITYRDNGRPTNVINDSSGQTTVVAPGCMLTWSPDNEFAMFISSKDGGKQKNQINRYDIQSGEIRKLLDLPGELSHEYFPRLDPSENYLVFAASDGAHEPDIEDYEIFIWKMDTPNSKAQRLTFDPGNDSWPDIYLD